MALGYRGLGLLCGLSEVVLEVVVSSSSVDVVGVIEFQ
jgi:hypothetical protein